MNYNTLSEEELLQVSGGKAPNISPEQAKQYFSDGVKAHLEMQAVFYFKTFCSHFSASEQQKMKNEFLQRFGHELTESRFYHTF